MTRNGGFSQLCREQNLRAHSQTYVSDFNVAMEVQCKNYW